MGGRMDPSTATTMPGNPATRHPTRMAAFTAMAPGVDWARAVMSSISFSSSQCSSSTNFRFMKVTMTYPPPKVKALIYRVAKNRVRSFWVLVRDGCSFSIFPNSFQTLCSQYTPCILMCKMLLFYKIHNFIA